MTEITNVPSEGIQPVQKEPQYEVNGFDIRELGDPQRFSIPRYTINNSGLADKLRRRFVIRKNRADIANATPVLINDGANQIAGYASRELKLWEIDDPFDILYKDIVLPRQETVVLYDDGGQQLFNILTQYDGKTGTVFQFSITYGEDSPDRYDSYGKSVRFFPGNNEHDIQAKYHVEESKDKDDSWRLIEYQYNADCHLFKRMTPDHSRPGGSREEYFDTEGNLAIIVDNQVEITHVEDGRLKKIIITHVFKNAQGEEKSREVNVTDHIYDDFGRLIRFEELKNEKLLESKDYVYDEEDPMRPRSKVVTYFDYGYRTIWQYDSGKQQRTKWILIQEEQFDSSSAIQVDDPTELEQLRTLLKDIESDDWIDLFPRPKHTFHQ